MKFRNIKTGNIISSENATAIALMQRSDRYEAVAAKADQGNATATDKVTNTAAK